MACEQILEKLADDSVELLCIQSVSGGNAGSWPSKLTQEQKTIFLELVESIGNLEDKMTQQKTSFKIEQTQFLSEDKALLTLRINDKYVLVIMGDKNTNFHLIQSRFDNFYRDEIINTMITEHIIKEKE